MRKPAVRRRTVPVFNIRSNPYNIALMQASEFSAAFLITSFSGQDQEDLSAAVAAAQGAAVAGDVVVLSPACAAFDRFKNFMERGRIFKELVNAL